MKVFKTILFILSTLLIIPLGLVMAGGAVWYTLPALATTELGLFITKYLSSTAIFWTVIGSTILYVVLRLLQIIFNRDLSAKLKNFIIHLNTWSMCLVALAGALYTFAMANPLVAQAVVITIPRKISIGICLICLIAFHILSGKVMKIINRKIQAYDNAKEANQIGRSSVIFINLLKLFEMFFPEMVVLALLCSCVSWNIASYFIIVIIAGFIPVIGNIESDFNTRREIKIKQRLEQDKLAEKIANLQSRG